MTHRLRDRLQLLAWLCLLALACVARAAPSVVEAESQIARADAVVVHTDAQVVRGVDSIGLTVSDMQRSLEFYTKVLPFERVSAREASGDAYEHLYGVFGAKVHIERLRLGDESIELMEFVAPRGRPIPVDSRSNDRWFQHVAIIVSDMDRAYAWLREHGVAHASTGPQLLPAWNPNAGGIAAFYFRDPDGHPLEILHFPPGKGAAKWQQPPAPGRNTLFLGIDHTAIAVSDTDASLRYYRDVLGMRVAGASENYGPEQERLNNVFGARLRITALRAASGPGVELLEYLAPRTGRPMPVDTQSNDLWHWQINVAADIDAADRAIRDGHYAYVSPGSIRLPDETMKLAAANTRPADDNTKSTGESRPADEAVRQPDRFSAALMARDPDGHAMLFGSPPNTTPAFRVSRAP